jgi:hypothetical protein
MDSMEEQAEKQLLFQVPWLLVLEESCRGRSEEAACQWHHLGLSMHQVLSASECHEDSEKEAQQADEEEGVVGKAQEVEIHHFYFPQEVPWTNG